MKLTSFQKQHRPVRRLEKKCNGAITADGFCSVCGRELKKNVAHNPNVIGLYGWTEYYSDGSVVNTWEV